MATLIPALGTCVSSMTSGEKRLAERLQDKLKGDYCLWRRIRLAGLSILKGA